MVVNQKQTMLARLYDRLGRIHQWPFLVTAVVLVLILLVRANSGLFLHGSSYVSNWRFTHYLFNYSDGFVKRGLVGDAFLKIFGEVRYLDVTIVSYVSVLLLAGFLIYFFFRAWIFPRKNIAGFILLLVAVGSPATLQHFFYDVGRFDVFVYLIFLISICFLLFFSFGLVVLRAFIVAFSVVFSLLIHEAAFFISLPMLLIIWSILDGSKGARVAQFLVAAMAVGVTYYIGHNGGYKLLSFEQHLAALKAVHGDRVVPASLAVLHKTTLSENFELTQAMALSWLRLIHHVVFFIVLAPLFYTIFQLACLSYRQCGSKSLIILLSAFSPLLLYPLGYDHFRWWSLAITNFFIALGVLAILWPSLLPVFFNWCGSHKALIAFVFISGLVLGPVLVMDSFAWMDILSLLKFGYFIYYMTIG